MSIRSRIFVNHATGTITDNPLIAGATTINSVEFASLPAVTAAGGIPLTLDPGGTNEEALITAHTASATSVTVVRPSSVEHAAGTTWVASLYAGYDLPQSPDILLPNDAKLIFSEEFNGEETTDPTDLTNGAWLNQGGSTFVRRMGHGVLTQPTSSASYAIRGVEFTAPALPASFLLMGKVWVSKIVEGNYFHQGIGFRESSSNKCFFVGYHFTSTLLVSWRATTNLTTETTPNGTVSIPNGRVGYFGIRKNSSDLWDAIFSLGGSAEIVIASSLALDTHFTPDRIFFGGDNRATGNVHTECDWIRMWDLT